MKSQKTAGNHVKFENIERKIVRIKKISGKPVKSEKIEIKIVLTERVAKKSIRIKGITKNSFRLKKCQIKPLSKSPLNMRILKENWLELKKWLGTPLNLRK